MPSATRCSPGAPRRAAGDVERLQERALADPAQRQPLGREAQQHARGRAAARAGSAGEQPRAAARAAAGARPRARAGSSESSRGRVAPRSRARSGAGSSRHTRLEISPSSGPWKPWLATTSSTVRSPRDAFQMSSTIAISAPPVPLSAPTSPTPGALDELRQLDQQRLHGREQCQRVDREHLVEARDAVAQQRERRLAGQPVERRRRSRATTRRSRARGGAPRAGAVSERARQLARRPPGSGDGRRERHRLRDAPEHVLDRVLARSRRACGRRSRRGTPCCIATRP